jgi:hypothetical protein
MAKLLLLIALCAVFAVAILAGPGTAARHYPPSTTPVATAPSNSTPAPPPAPKGNGGGHMHY